MKRRITYKEITLALGILVAVVVAITLWVNQPAEQTSTHSGILPVPATTVAKSVIRTAVDIIF